MKDRASLSGAVASTPQHDKCSGATGVGHTPAVALGLSVAGEAT